MAPPKLSPNSACLQCKGRKTKCDGVQPRCGLCTRLDKDCVFVNQTRRTKAEILEERLLELEQELDTTRKGPFRPSVLGHKIWRAAHSLVPQPSLLMPTETPNRILLMAIYPYSKDRPSSSNLPQRPAHLTEPYSVVVPLESVQNALRQWDPSTDVPAHLRDILVRVMLPFRHHLNFHLHIDTFLTDIHRPQNDPRSIHPSLLYAIYVYSCSLGSSREMSLYEPTFLSRARHYIHESLAYADRLLDTIWAQLIISAYYARTGRIAQAYTELSGAIRFAIACGLNRLSDTGDAADKSMRCLLSHPQDAIQFAERVNLWWALSIADHIMWLSHGLPRTIVDQEVTTPWPQCITKLRRALDLDPHVPRNTLYPKNAALNSVLTLKAKSLGILTRAKQLCLVSKQKVIPHEFHALHRTLARDLDDFHACLPVPTDCRALRLTEPHQAGNPSLLWSHLYAVMADMYLYNIYASESLDAYARTLKASMEMGALLRMAGGSELVTPLHAMHTLLQCASVAIEVLAREIRIATLSSSLSDGGSPTSDYASSSSSSSPLMSAIPSPLQVMIIQPASSNPHYQAPPPVELGTSLRAREQRIYAAHESLESILTSLYELSHLFPTWRASIERLRLVFLEAPVYETI